MYPSGVGTSYADPRRSNVTKSQSMHFSRGISALKDMSESSANGQNYPTDELGTNLRRGKGLSFSNGIAQFDRFGPAGGLQPGLSRQAEMAPEMPSYDAYMNYHKTTANHSTANGTYLQGTDLSDEQRVQRADDQKRATEYRPSSSSRYSASNRTAFRPTSAPANRNSLGPHAATSNGELPAWAKDQVFHPTFDKTVDNAKARPGSARIRPQSGLPLSFVPKWISQDKKVLTFEAYFKEAVHESRLEHYRVRRCVVNYFLEDDTIKVSEPREENSGLPQGNFLKRHKVVKEGVQGGFMTWRDLKVPGDLSLYGRVFRVTKCDDFTADFYRARGYAVASESAEAVPVDPVREARSRPSSAHTVVSVGRDGEPQSFHGRMKNDMTDYIEARLGRCQDTKARVTKYLANDRKVLRFYASWNDKTTDGVVLKRPFVVHFFLADDTVEVLEVKEPNSGRDPFPALLKRMKLPKLFLMKGVALVGGDLGGEHYKATDLVVGGVITVFGRQLVLNDCDSATRAFYEEEYGIVQGDAQGKASGGRPKSAIVVPPHNGFGKEEDSRQNCISLHPKAPKMNVIRLLENKGKMLRFVGKLEHAVGFDVERVFTITYFLDTDEILIFEPAVKNSGRTGGKFMERCRVRKPQSSEYYGEADLFLGARISIYSRRFVLVDADEFSIKYMEQHGHEYPYSDVSAIARKVQSQDLGEAAALFRKRDPMGTGSLPADTFKECVVRGGLGLNDQEAHTLARSLAKGGTVDYERMLAAQGGGGGRPPRRGRRRRRLGRAWRRCGACCTSGGRAGCGASRGRWRT